MQDLANMSDAQFEELIYRMRAIGSDSRRCEVKSARADLPKDIGPTISSFSNGEGGLIILGLSEKDGFAPVEGFDAKRMQDTLIDWCKDKMEPAIYPITDIRLLDGKPVLTAYINELKPRDKPCYIKKSGSISGSYIRVGDGDRHLSPYEVNQMLEEHRQPLYDIEVIENATQDDLDPMLVSALLLREGQVHARNFAQFDNTTALIKLHILAEGTDGELHPTLGGLLALGRYPQYFFPRLCVNFTCYPGLTKTDGTGDGRRFTDMYTCIGSIPAMVQDTLAAVRRNMRTGARIVDGFRHDVPDYPLDAVREALVNALMHRDYSPDSRGTAVAVDLYADRLVISNPGGLYGGTTILSLGKQPVMSTRNQYFASILESTPLDTGTYVAENRGSGYNIIKESLRKAGMPEPVPTNSLSYFSLALYRKLDEVPASFRPNPTQQITTSMSYEQTGASILQLDDYIVHVITLKGTASMAELIAATGRSRPTVLKSVQKLISRGRIRPTESKNSPKQRYMAV